MIIDQDTDLFGVIGNPLRHSLSPALHNAGFSETGLNAVYLAFETGDIEGCIRGIRALGVKGASVTIPFKTTVIPYLDEMDALAHGIGAVNTIVNDNGRLKGYNTDALGAVMALEEEVEISGMTCLIIGAGGAARAIGFMLRERGADIVVTNRSSGRGKELARSLECPFVSPGEIGDTTADILVQTTPVGMYPHVDQCPVAEHVIKEGMVVMDIIYNPFETRLMKVAKARGCVTIGGMSMFIHQGAEQFRIWSGIRPSLNTIRRAVERELSRQSEKH